MTFFREYLLIIAGGLIGAALGAGFGALVGLISPEFIVGLMRPLPVHFPVRLGAAFGMIAGLFIGAAGMVAGRLVGVIRERTESD